MEMKLDLILNNLKTNFHDSLITTKLEKVLQYIESWNFMFVIELRFYFF
jgi:hypothetical protein